MYIGAIVAVVTVVHEWFTRAILEVHSLQMYTEIFPKITTIMQTL